MGFSAATVAALALFWVCPNVAWMQWLSVALVGVALYGPQMLIGLCGAEAVSPPSVSACQGFLGWIAYLGEIFVQLATNPSCTPPPPFLNTYTHSQPPAHTCTQYGNCLIGAYCVHFCAMKFCMQEQHLAARRGEVLVLSLCQSGLDK